jgi:hypothetical protein
MKFVTLFILALVGLVRQGFAQEATTSDLSSIMMIGGQESMHNNRNADLIPDEEEELLMDKNENRNLRSVTSCKYYCDKKYKYVISSCPRGYKPKNGSKWYSYYIGSKPWGYKDGKWYKRSQCFTGCCTNDYEHGTGCCYKVRHH